MPTDTERREVARRLRMSRSEWSGMGWKLWLGPKFGAVVLSDGNRDELEDAAHRLADLIEPSCDRDALLALAAEMAADSVRSAKQGSSVSPVYILHAARNIAEACGETFGSIRNRELAKWGTSIVPKETIVDRDALLELADILGSARETDCRGCRLEGAGCAECSSGVAHEAARRIREALGVEQ